MITVSVKTLFLTLLGENFSTGEPLERNKTNWLAVLKNCNPRSAHDVL